MASLGDHFEALLSFICTETASLVNASLSLLRLSDSAQGLVLRRCYGVMEQSVFPTAFSTYSETWRAAQLGKPLILDDLSLISEIRSTVMPQSALLIPMKANEQIIGTLELFDKRGRSGQLHFTEDDLYIADIIASVGAQKIENVRLCQDISLARTELENVFQSISEMVYFTDLDYTIRQVNQAVVNKLELTEQEIIGQKCYQLFHKTNEPWRNCPHHKTLIEGKAFVEEIEDAGMGGIFVVSSSPLFDSAGNLMGAVHISRDVTEFHAMRTKLNQSERRAALGDIAAQVAHEIRNPLTPIGGFARQLQKRLDGPLKDYASIIVEEVNRLEKVLKEILSFVRDERLEKCHVEINSMLDDVIHLVKNEIELTGNQIKRHFSTEPISVEADYARIKEAFRNIIENANQATKNGIITVTTSINDKKAFIQIEDTGRGIKEENLKKVFNPFFTTQFGKTGLGLTIAYRIIEEHKGIIDVESRWTQGSVFKVYLPLKEA
jgi:PAS domain S-box-containing protein